ncbi:hypothetical protein GGH98_002452, partial [Coemansia sp. RSA 454]
MNLTERRQAKKAPPSESYASFSAYPLPTDSVTTRIPRHRNSWDHQDRWNLVVLTLLSLFTRLYRIGRR